MKLGKCLDKNTKNQTRGSQVRSGTSTSVLHPVPYPRSPLGVEHMAKFVPSGTKKTFYKRTTKEIKPFPSVAAKFSCPRRLHS